MEDFLRNDFTTHYALPVCTVANLTLVTDEPYFEIEDTKGEIALHTTVGQGTARFSNLANLTMTIVNYDKFVTSLPSDFRLGKKRCDIIVTCDADRYFVLGEIKNSHKIKRRGAKAQEQLLESLTALVAVPQISALIHGKAIKRCCYFNKQSSSSPAPINAVAAFNRLAGTVSSGLKMTHSGIEGLNFEYWEYLGGQTLTLTR